MPVTAGFALAEKLRGSRGIACCFIGEGTLGEGAVYEAANLMALWSLPALVIIENNRYSQSTPQEEALAGEIPARFRAFGIRCFETDTWNLEGLYQTLGEAVSWCRKGKPGAVCIGTDRLMAHSKGDDDRPREVVERLWERDLLRKFQKEDPVRYGEYEAAARRRIDAAVEAALAAAWPSRPVLSTVPAGPLRWRRPEPGAGTTGPRINERLRDCFRGNMERDGRILHIGEDLRDPYGGAFKVTRGLSDAFPGRVLGTPISEAAIAGLGNGLALGGFLPVCEIMFGDFLTLAFDQVLNHAAKFTGMYGKALGNALIIRSPVGGGRGYGPTHSQSLEKHFLGIPGLQVLAINHRYDPGALYDRLFRTIDGPVLVLENKALYGRRLVTAPEPGFVLEYGEGSGGEDPSWPTVRIRPEGRPEVTLLCYGGTLALAEEVQAAAFEEAEILTEVICPLCLYPLDMRPILGSLAETGRLLIVEEGQGFAAWGGEVIARVLEQAGPGLLRAVRRVSAAECSIPCSGPLEAEVLPHRDQVLEVLKEMMNYGR